MLPRGTNTSTSLTASRMQTEFVRRTPDPPMVVRHLDMRRAEKPEGVVDRIGETRHAADIRALADALGADGMVRRGRRRPIRLPFRRLDRSRQEIIHQ